MENETRQRMVVETIQIRYFKNIRGVFQSLNFNGQSHKGLEVFEGFRCIRGFSSPLYFEIFVDYLIFLQIRGLFDISLIIKKQEKHNQNQILSYMYKTSQTTVRRVLLDAGQANGNITDYFFDVSLSTSTLDCFARISERIQRSDVTLVVCD